MKNFEIRTTSVGNAHSLAILLNKEYVHSFHGIDETQEEFMNRIKDELALRILSAIQD